MEKIQEKIDEYKQQIPDEVYRQLCSITLEEYSEEEHFYKIKYVQPTHWYEYDERFESNSNQICVGFFDNIIKVKNKDYEKIKKDIDNNGYCINYYIDNKRIISENNIRQFNTDSRCDCCEEVRYFNLETESKIYSIEKV